MWKHDGQSILIDGHNRYAICQKHGKKFQTVEVELEDRDHVKLWIHLSSHRLCRATFARVSTR
ncbi:MAG: hypothetical protein ACRDHZ_05440 [Ktedonobacteraceae bacterium]